MIAGDLPSPFGPAVSSARIRSVPEDFRVDECLGFEADGEGEHLLVRIEKTGANTEWVARQLARCAGIPPRSVGYAGLKDRHAVTTQSFTLHLAGVEMPDLSLLQIDGVRVLGAARHRRKLPRGALRGNRFSVRLREVTGSRDAIDARLRCIAARGFPNYFGEQRFGRDGENVENAVRQLASGERLAREKRSMMISSLRSALFNEVLAARVVRGDWDRLIPGDLAVLAGSRSFFAVASEPDQVLAARASRGDVHPSGPLWGRGESPAGEEAGAIERAVASGHPDLVAALAKAGAEHARRPLRALADALQWQWEDQTTLLVSCTLGAGSYMTTLLSMLGTTDPGESRAGHPE